MTRIKEEQFDVVVCGGGMAGFSAAVAAARHGAKTALVQDRPVLGGNSSSEVRVTVHGSAAVHGYARETGIISEALAEERARNHAAIEENGWTNSVWDLTLYDIAQRTENLSLYLNSAVTGVTMQDDKIASVDARVANAETIIRFSADYVIDCTGDGTVGALADVTSFYGIESKEEYGEFFAPPEASRETMGSSLHFKTVDTGKPVPFKAPAWAETYDDDQFFETGGRQVKTLASGYWWIELGPPWHTVYDNEELRHELTRHVLGIWDYLKNRHPYWSKHASNLALDWVGQVPGKRESRRLLGEHVITEADLQEAAKFDDEVAFGGWYIDLHTPGGLYASVAEPATEELIQASLGNHKDREDDPKLRKPDKYVRPYGIPLRSLVSREVRNLLFAGRNISSTHVALGSLRVMGTAATMGQAAGTHAALLVTADADDASDYRFIGDLQQTLLRDGCFLPNVKNDDEKDLARTAVVTATSAQSVTGVGPSSTNNLANLGQWSQGHPVYPRRGELSHRLAQWIAVGDGDSIDTLSVCLTNNGQESREIEFFLEVTNDIWDYNILPEREIRRGSLTIRPGGPQWVDLEIAAQPDELRDVKFVRLLLGDSPDVEWVVSPHLLPGQLAAYEVTPSRLRRFGGGSTLSFRVSPPLNPYRPENVQSGVTRPGAGTNVWRSDPLNPLPQALKLAWPDRQTVSQIQLTFAGNLLREYHATPPMYRDPQTVKSYIIEGFADGEWTVLARNENNYAQRVVHTWEPTQVETLKVTVYETNGDPSAAIYEVRCYEDPTCTTPAY